MDAHSLKVLEYDEILKMLRERTACALGDDVAHQLQPTTDFLSITEWLKETSEASKIIMEEGSLPLGGIHDIRASVNKACLDAILQPSELQDIADTLNSGRSLRGYILKRAERFPKLAEIAVNIGQFQQIESSVRQTIGINGEIADSASPELASVRSKLKITQSRLVDKLHSIIQSSEFRTMIQDPVVTQRGDRYCIPVKAEFRPHFPGIVHDSSASGATVFIEPASVIEMGNDIRELSARELQEIEKILRRLTGMVRTSADDIRITVNSLGRIDFISAKARLSCDLDASEPILNRDGKIDMIRARHPLLKGEVVPISVELGGRFKTLLITGPNTGGKTVTLKTIGLLTLMAQSGLHVSADPGTKMAIFSDVFADIGDEQSIQQSLSTFSSHMTNIVNIISRIGRNSLILLDEIGAGTDPEEGAALAKAILDHLVSVGARTVATTHYGELKEFAFLRDGVENASVEFDIQTLRPTYRLMVGVPGSSNAFAIAARLGLQDDIVNAARLMVNSEDSSDEMIRRIEESHRAAAEREQIAERTSKDVEVLRTRYEDRLDEMESLRREMKRQIAEELDRKVHEKVEELDYIINELKQQKTENRTVHEGRQMFKERVKEIETEVEEMLPPVFEDTEENVKLKAGDNVKVTTFNLDGILMNNPDDGDAQVMIGSMKVNVPFAVLRSVRRSKTKHETQTIFIPPAKTSNISAELKLIAQRAEQALINLDKYLDDAYLAGLPSVRIIHGKGTGALRKAVWEFLSDHHAVESYKLADAKEGGSGATIVQFKNR
ncbi:MAG: endonuclease MutS2 [Armatimonadota bacterium]